jgi:hypothetical protein
MPRHSGGWGAKCNSEYILASGKALMEPFERLSHQDFKAYAKQEYNADYRRSLDWMNTAKRFEDRPELIKDLPETVIRKLAAPCLESYYEQIISDIRAKRVKPDCRSVNNAIREYKKNAKAGYQQEESDATSDFMYSSQSTPLPKTALDEIERNKDKLETLRLASKKDLSALDKEEIDRGLAYKAEMEEIKTKKIQRRAEIRDFDNHIQAFNLVLKLHGRVSQTHKEPPNRETSTG